MKDTELKQARDVALYETYVKALQTGSFSSIREAVEYAVRQPAPSFFISSKNLSLLIGRLQKGDKLERLHPDLRRKIIELNKRYNEYRRNHPKEKISRERVCEIIADDPAPEYYLSPLRGIHLINEQRKINREKFLRDRR